jgi:electron transport complex protein RnfC
MLMREHAADIVAGSAIMAAIAGAERCIIAIERDKPDAIAAVHAALDESNHRHIAVAEIPTIYPAGGERQLIDVLTGIEIPAGRYPGDVGIVCQNAGTAFAVARLALRGEPLTSRIVTVTGDAVAGPANVEVPIGSPVSELIAFCGGYEGQPVALVHGGSMMGYALTTDSLPVSKATNCLFAAAAQEIRRDAPEWPCIRCGECALACPAQLLPQELLIAARRRDTEGLTALSLEDCIECGCCDVVCPSLIPLTGTFREAKLELERTRLRDELSAQSAERFRHREDRARALAAAEAARLQALKERVDDPAARREAIAAAVERARRRRGPDGE